MDMDMDMDTRSTGNIVIFGDMAITGEIVDIGDMSIILIDTSTSHIFGDIITAIIIGGKNRNALGLMAKGDLYVCHAW